MCSTVTRPFTRSNSRGTKETLDAELLAAADEPQQHLVRRLREGDDHLLDVVVDDYLVEVPAGAEHGHGDCAVERIHRLLVQEADRLEAELGIREQPLRDEAADTAGADDQRRAHRLALPARLRLRPVQGDAARDQVSGGERPRADRLRGQVDGLAEELAEGQHRHRGQRRRGDDAAEVLEQLGLDPGRVQPPQREEEHHQPDEGDQAGRRRRGHPCRVGTDRRREAGDREHRQVDDRSREPPRALRPSALDPLDDREIRHGLQGLVHRSGLIHGLPGYARVSVSSDDGCTDGFGRRLLRLTPIRSSGPPPAMSRARSRPLKGKPSRWTTGVGATWATPVAVSTLDSCGAAACPAPAVSRTSAAAARQTIRLRRIGTPSPGKCFPQKFFRSYLADGSTPPQVPKIGA